MPAQFPSIDRSSDSLLPVRSNGPATQSMELETRQVSSLARFAYQSPAYLSPMNPWLDWVRGVDGVVSKCMSASVQKPCAVKQECIWQWQTKWLYTCCAVQFIL